MIFYRGITVEPIKANKIIEHIKINGITGKEGKSYCVHDVKYSISTLLNNSNLNSEMTRPSRRIYTKNGFYKEYIDSNNCVCCSSDINTARYYANIHNKSKINTKPLIIKFKMPISEVYIDGRDFLYYAFGKDDINKVLPILKDLYGSNIIDYYKRAITKKDIKYRTAIVDLVCQDESIITDHYNNDKCIKGRYNTEFKSAFMVKAPILPTDIIEILQDEYLQPNTIAYSISDL